MDLTKKSLFLLDMDGTVYHENDLIDGAREFLSHLKNNGMEYLFMTNNSSKSAEDYVNKLTKMGIMAAYNDIFTSVQAAGV